MGARDLLARTRRWLAGAAAVSSLLAGGSAAAQPHVIRDPHYGDALFHFFQQRYFTSVTNLMVSQHFDRVSQHADEAEVLRGGMLLSYGLHREAGEIFAQLIERGAAPPVRDRAWYYLAKIRYQRGFLDQAEQALARVEGALPGELEEDRVLLHAQLLMARSDYAQAAAVLQRPAAAGSAARYARYNLGVALIRSGDLTRGVALLDQLGREPAPTEEFRSLRDKANVALGFAALQQQKPEAARGYLERVRLHGMQANKALLGFGWAAATLKQPKQALVPWTELATRDPGDAAVLEARIAVPYALAEVGAVGQALEGYHAAIAAFDDARGALDESIAAIRDGRLVAGLLQHNPGDEMGWFWNIRELPQMPHAAHLTQVLAQHEFQEAFKNYRDLQFLARNLLEWEERLGVFATMLANRRQGYAERLPQVQSKARDIDLQALRLRRDGVARELELAEKQSDGIAFADAREREQLARLANVHEILERSAADADGAAARERARRTAGALLWQLAQQHPARLWDARKALKSIDAELAEAVQRDARLSQAQRDEPARFERLAARIAELDRRLRAMTPQVLALSREQQHQVQELAVAALDRQKERLAVYATQARFAIAELHDRANLARGTDHAKTQP